MNEACGCKGTGGWGYVSVSASVGGLARLTQGKKHPSNRSKQALDFPFHLAFPSSVPNIITCLTTLFCKRENSFLFVLLPGRRTQQLFAVDSQGMR